MISSIVSLPVSARGVVVVAGVVVVVVMVVDVVEVVPS